MALLALALSACSPSKLPAGDEPAEVVQVDWDGYDDADSADGDSDDVAGVDLDPHGSPDAATPEPDTDADDDGWVSEAFGGLDCDDTDPDVNPVASDTVGDDVDSNCDGADYGIEGLVVGDLVLTEIMYDPVGLEDGEGEWFEVYNGTGHAVNLRGLFVSDHVDYPVADTFTVETDLVAGAGARLVFAVSRTLADAGIPTDYEYGGRGVNFHDADDDLRLGVRLKDGGYTTIDAVTYDERTGWPGASGASIELAGAALSASDNDAAANWCLATSTAGGTTDLGSPGSASSGC